MLSEDKYFRDLTEAELWQRYCGFLDLSIDQFMEIQENLLMEQIGLVADSLLGKNRSFLTFLVYFNLNSIRNLVRDWIPGLRRSSIVK